MSTSSAYTPDAFTHHAPMKSIFHKFEHEVVAWNIIKILSRTGDTWRTLTWDDYQIERKKDGNFTLSEKFFFEQVQPHTETEKSVRAFSPYWATL